MKSKIIVLLTVLLAIVTLSAISDDSDATSKVTIFDDNLYMNPYNSYHMIYDSDTDTYSNLEFLAGMYQITVYSYVEFNCGTISEYLNSGETFSFIVDYNCWGTINAYGSNEPIRCVVSSLDDCYIAYYYDYGHTTLDVVAGPYTYTGPTAYLCFGNYSMRLNSSGEIPFDYNGAHFQVILPENIVILRVL